MTLYFGYLAYFFQLNYNCVRTSSLLMRCLGEKHHHQAHDIVLFLNLVISLYSLSYWTFGKFFHILYKLSPGWLFPVGKRTCHLVSSHEISRSAGCLFFNLRLILALQACRASWLGRCATLFSRFVPFLLISSWIVGSLIGCFLRLSLLIHRAAFATILSAVDCSDLNLATCFITVLVHRDEIAESRAIATRMLAMFHSSTLLVSQAFTMFLSMCFW